MKSLSGTNVAAMTQIAVIAALYVVSTVMIAPLSYGIVQLRFSEALMLLCAYKFDYCIALTLGCFISNLFSPTAIFDVPLGSAATLISALLMYKCKRLYPSALICSVVNAIVIGIELTLVFNEPFLLAALSVFLGEFAVVFIIGASVFSKIESKAVFKRYIGTRTLKKTKNKNN